jgi:hypothetical protein
MCLRIHAVQTIVVMTHPLHHIVSRIAPRVGSAWAATTTVCMYKPCVFALGCVDGAWAEEQSSQTGAAAPGRSQRRNRVGKLGWIRLRRYRRGNYRKGMCPCGIVEYV